MKKLFYSLAAIAALFATACTTDASSDVQMAGESKVTFSLQAKGLGSRAINDGTKATELTYAIYDGDWDLLDTKELSFSAGSLEMQLTLDLVKNQTYNFVFWAQSENAGCYTLNLPQKGEPSVDVDYSALESNNDDLDAFYGKVLGLEVKGTVNETVELRRPFAQINFGTDDLERAAQLGFDLANAKVSVTTKTYNKFYLNDGRVDGAMQDVTFTDATPIDTTADAMSLKAGDSNYHWVSMNYILWPDATDLSLSTCEMEIKVEGREPVKIEVPGAPARRNWRTNLVGSLLTDKSNVKVVIKPEPEGEQTNTNGYYIVNGVYHITSGKGLAWLADEVNNGTNNFSGKTVVLDGDIDLDGFTRANAEWTPIGGKGHYFAGIFDGAGYTVKNFNVNQEGHAGLFGNVRGTIKNLTVENVIIVANHYAGAIVGQGYARIENCHVNNIDITLTTKNGDWGDKAGGIIGQNCEGYLYVKNSSAKNVTIKGYRDLGGIAGMAHNNNTVSGCSVKNITITQDLSDDYEVPAKRNTLGGVVGRVGSSITIKENTEKNVNIGTLVNNQAELANALSTGLSSIILAEGNYELSTLAFAANNVTLSGVSKEGVTLNLSKSIYLQDKSVTLKNLTYAIPAGLTYNEHAFSFVHHAVAFNLVNCNVNRLRLNVYSSAIDGCQFDINTNSGFDGYSLYYYGNSNSNVVVKNSTFNTAGKAIVMYNEGPSVLNLDVEKCTFVSSNASTDKAAIQMHTELGISGTLDIVDCTATGFATGVASGNQLWNEVNNNTNQPTKNFTITVDGELVQIAGTSFVESADDLVEALENGEDVYMTEDVKINPAGMSNAYGTTGINVKNGQTINGNDHTLDIKGAGGTWDSGISTTGGLIKNITVTGSFRGIFVNHNSSHAEKVVLENVIIDGTTYTISCDKGTNNGLEATNSTFNGWTSYAATLGNAKFVGCSFGEGNGYAYCRPYAPTEFVNCQFEAGFKVDPRANVTFKNCTFGGVALTTENLATLVTSIGNASVIE